MQHMPSLAVHLITHMGVGKGGAKALHVFLKSSAKKGCFPTFDWEKTNAITFRPPLEKSPSVPHLENILPTPMITQHNIDKITHDHPT